MTVLRKLLDKPAMIIQPPTATTGTTSEAVPVFVPAKKKPKKKSKKNKK